MGTRASGGKRPSRQIPGVKCTTLVVSVLGNASMDKTQDKYRVPGDSHTAGRKTIGKRKSKAMAIELIQGRTHRAMQQRVC
jgi:hypothetical protein